MIFILKKYKIGNYTLDKYQTKIIKSNRKIIQVIAGAGSGKTLTLTEKIKYLIQRGMNPNEILCITFTKAAALSLQNKLEKENIKIKVHTFHSLSYNLIKNHYPNNLVNINVLNEIIEKHLEKININDYTYQTKNNSKNNLKETINRFITLFKGNNYNKEKFKEFSKINKETNDYYKYSKHNNFLKLTKKIYLDYQKYLIKNNNIDFSDMINLGINVINKYGIYPYKYIIIDEYQDISKNKCELIKEIIKKTNAKLLVVGDDWQSIYSFTGSNLEVFTNFKKYFPGAKRYYLKNTYRNSKQLLNITSKFIKQNPNQLSKKLLSIKENNKPIKIYYYKDNINKTLTHIIEKLKDKETLILGRNNKDEIKNLPKNVKFLTIHKSKGLEADNVIIINLTDENNSLPSKQIVNEFLKYVVQIKDDYPFSEERRLFYVALTRTKNDVYLLVPENNPSIFVEELINKHKNKIEINSKFL